MPIIGQKFVNQDAKPMLAAKIVEVRDTCRRVSPPSGIGDPLDARYGKMSAKARHA